jgi:hypothetical protein
VLEVPGSETVSVHAFPLRKLLLDLFVQFDALGRHEYITRFWINQVFVLVKRTFIFIIYI